MVALLGLLAVAGYQNREKLGEVIKQARQGPADGNADGQSQPGILSELGAMFSDGAAGGTLLTGLQDLLDQFKQAGNGDTAESWVNTGPNRELDTVELERTIGADTLAELSRKTGLDQEEVLSRLATNIPTAVDRFTPEGRLPSEQEAARFV